MPQQPVEVEIDKASQRTLTRQLSNVSRSVRNKAVRTSIKDLTKIGVDEVRKKLKSVKVTGATYKSIKSDIRTKRGVVTGRVGQARNKVFKLGKRIAKRRGLSAIQAAGKPTPIWWIDLGTRAHGIKASGKRLRFTVGGRLVSVGEVRHPGARGKNVLKPVHDKLQRIAPGVFINGVSKILSQAGA